VPEAEGGDGELQRHEERLGQRVEPVITVLDDILHDRRVGDALFEEVVDDDVLVVLA
jgi:hypothetical protein